MEAMTTSNETRSISILRRIALMLWLCGGLYFGVSGYLVLDLKGLKQKANSQKEQKIKVGNLTFENQYAFVYFEDSRKIEQMFPYLKHINETFGLVITALAFGALGGITRIFKQGAFEGLSINEVSVIYLPLIGMLCGIFVLGISYVVPTLLVAGDQKVRPETLVFFSLFSGLFSKRFHQWLSINFDTFFKNKAS